MADNFNDIIQDRIIRHMVMLEGLKNRQAKEVLKFLNEDIIPDLLNQLEARYAKIEKFGFDRGKETTKRLEALITELSTVTGRFKELKANTREELIALARQEAEWQTGVFNEESGVDLNLETITATQLKEAVFAKPFDGRTLDEWFERLEESARTRLTQELRRGVTEGLTTQQIVRRIKNDGYLKITRAQTEAVVRTGVSHVANAARDALYNANADIMAGVRINAVLDTRTCPTCAALDGKVYPLNKGARPPFHVGCRCTASPVTKTWRELGIDVDEIPDSTRASMNGQVPSDITYNEWLKKQPADIQEIALGKTRAKLFRAGGLDVQNFVNQNRVQFTLADLRKREAGAFSKAGLK